MTAEEATPLLGSNPQHWVTRGRKISAWLHSRCICVALSVFLCIIFTLLVAMSGPSFQDKGGLKVESHLSIESLQPFAGNNEELLFLVGGGYNKSDDGSTTTELLSLEHSGDPLSYCKRSRCPTIGGAMKSVGAVFNGTPYLFGVGKWDDRILAYDVFSDRWTVTGRMAFPRWNSAGAYTPKLGLVIAGGSPGREGYAPLTVERTLDGHNFEVLSHLPYDLNSHCVVALSDNSIFITGGVTRNETPRKSGGQSVFNTFSFIYDIGSDSWYEIQGLPTPRMDVACGPARWFAGEVQQVVVVGGTRSFETNAPATSIVEIYMVKANKWTTGANLSFGVLTIGTAVPYKDTFLLVGGEKTAYKEYYNSAYKYSSFTEGWEQFPLRLENPAGGYTALLVPQHLFCPCPLNEAVGGICKFPFHYDGYSYEACLKNTDGIQPRSLCPPVAVQTRNSYRRWYECSTVCPSTASYSTICTQRKKTIVNTTYKHPCMFPFKWQNRSLTGCIRKKGEHAEPECPLAVDWNYNPIHTTGGGVWKRCGQNCPIAEDCQWSLWGEWDPCSKQCGGGLQKRSRAQSKATHGGKPCEGQSSQTRWCNKQICSSWLISMTTILVAIVIILYLRWKAARKPARDIVAMPNLNLNWPISSGYNHKAKCVRSDSILPEGWEEQTSADGNVVFIDHITRQTSHQHPRTGMPGNQFNSFTKEHFMNTLGVVLGVY